MASDKLNEIFERAVSKSENNQDLLDKKIDDTDKVNDTYNL